MADEDAETSSRSPSTANQSPNAGGANRGLEQRRRALSVSIHALVLVVAAFAMAFAGLRTASKLWYNVLYTFTAFLLLTAVLAARYRRGYERAFWFGFAVFGWGFFLLGYKPWINAFEALDEDTDTPLNSKLLTTRVILLLLPHLRRAANDLGAIDDITQTTIGIAHLLMTLFVGIAGGLIAVLLRRGARKRISASFVASLSGLALVASIATSIYSARPTSRFFPAGALSEREDLSEFVHDWYSQHLIAMGEDPLGPVALRDRDATIYRLLWLPSFHHPVCVRVERKGEEARLRATVLDGKGGYDPGQIAIERRFRVDAETWHQLERLLDEAKYWTLPTRLASDDVGCDGDQLVLEGVRRGNYHVVDRWAPERAYANVCRYLLTLTGVDVSKQWNDYHVSESTDHPG
jgi:hypothetical protein